MSKRVDRSEAVEALQHSPTSDFSLGDVVRLKSGGPAMTVQGFDQFTCSCVWFNGSILKEDSFLAEMLERATSR
jgi:uncharacterized protein YodC (DUF2158 family)